MRSLETLDTFTTRSISPAQRYLKVWKSTPSSLGRLFRFHRWTRCDRASFQAYKNGVYLFLKELVEIVPNLHFLALILELTALTQSQIVYAGVKAEGRFKRSRVMLPSDA